MVEDIGQEIFNAIRKDDLKSFEKYANDERAKAISFGRFPILSLCYLYNAKKIVKKYEDELLRIKSYVVIEEKYEMYLLFKQKAGRMIRLYAGKNQIVHPLEMLSILMKASHLEQVYSKAMKSNAQVENLVAIEKIKSSSDIQISETKIALPKQPINSPIFKYAMIAVAVLLVFAITFSLSIIGIINAGFGTQEHPYKVTGAEQLSKAMEQNAVIELSQDIEIEYLALESFSGKLNGNGHTITIKEQKTNIIDKFTGSISNVNFVINAQMSTNVSSSLFINTNNGDISNVKFDIKGKMEYSGSSTQNTMIPMALIINENNKDVKDIDVNLDVEVSSNGYSNVRFAAFVQTNTKTIENVSISGKVKLNELVGAVCTYLNDEEAIIKNVQNSASLELTAKELSMELALSAIVCENAGEINNCINTGNISLTSERENGHYAYIGGIVTFNYLKVAKCKNEGSIAFKAKAAYVRIGGIAAQTEAKLNQYMDIEECASVGKISVNTENELSQCFVGGLIGYTGNATRITKCYSMADGAKEGLQDLMLFGGITAVLSTYGTTLDKNAYLSGTTIEHGLYTYSIFSGYTSYDTGDDGMFDKYTTKDEIKALEIYW